MPAFWLFLLILGLGVVGYFVGRQRVLASAGGDMAKMHSLPTYYGSHILILTIVPAVVLLFFWVVLQPILISNSVANGIPPEAVKEGSTIGLLMGDVQRVAGGLDEAIAQGAMTPEYADDIRVEFTDVRDRLAAVGVALGSDVDSSVLRAAQEFRDKTAVGNLLRAILVLGVGVAGFVYAFMRTKPDFRARNIVETFVRWMLITAAR